MSLSTGSLGLRTFFAKCRIFFKRGRKPRSAPIFSPPTPSKEAIAEIGRILASSESYIALTGPAVSALSGFKDLRDPSHNIWTKYSYKLWDYKLFQRKPELVWRMWPEIDKAVSKIKPNVIHEILGQWQIDGKLDVVITQNYDSANDKAALDKLIEIEGSNFFATCTNCGTYHKRPYVQQKLLQAAPEKIVYLPPSETDKPPEVNYSLPDDPEFMSEQDKKHVKMIKTPLCSRCFGPLKYDIPMRNEPSKGLPYYMALTEIREAPEVFLGIGFNDLKEQAELLPALARTYGAKVIFVNEEATDFDDQADIVVHGKIDDLIQQIDEARKTAEKEKALA